MLVLVTGGTGVIGTSTMAALYQAGHHVRVLSRHADRDRERWPVDVEAFTGDVSDEESIRGAASACDVVVHVAGIIEEKPPATFEAVNIQGTRYVVLEAQRAGVRKFVYVSSLGADRGKSGYHRSKRVGEDVVRTFDGDWVIVRPGAVYGPGDEHLSVLLRMVRTLPMIPTIGDGDQQFQPIWHEDFAKSLVQVVERADVRCREMDVAGGELTSQNDLVRRMRVLTKRDAIQAPIPEAIAAIGLRMLDAVGVDVPLSEAQLEMLTEGNVVDPSRGNALAELGITPTPLDEGLRRLADEQPEQLPSHGRGALTRKIYSVEIRDSRFDADGLFEHLRANLFTLMPELVEMRAEPLAARRVELGETLTLSLPLRGHVQVRVAECGDRRLTLLTVAGHPIAGAVRMLVEQFGPSPNALRFLVEVFVRPASLVDQVAMATVGRFAQHASWIGLVENVARAAGGVSDEPRSSEERLDKDELARIDDWLSGLAAQLSRNAMSGGRD